MEKISSVRFYKEIMDSRGCSFKEVVEAVLSLQEQGLIHIEDFDNYGVPAVFWRTDNPPPKKNDWKHIDDIGIYFED